MNDSPLEAPRSAVQRGTAGATVAAAGLRLAASRAQLRLSLLGPTPAPGAAAAAPGWWARLRALPAARVLIDAARGWWALHPWHAAGNAAAMAVNAALQPLARRHPWALAAAALLAGGLIAAARPWRWRARAAAGDTLHSLLQQALPTLPVATWLVLLAGLAEALSRAAADTAEAMPDPSAADAAPPAAAEAPAAA